MPVKPSFSSAGARRRDITISGSTGHRTKQEDLARALLLDVSIDDDARAALHYVIAHYPDGTTQRRDGRSPLAEPFLTWGADQVRLLEEPHRRAPLDWTSVRESLVRELEATLSQASAKSNALATRLIDASWNQRQASNPVLRAKRQRWPEFLWRKAGLMRLLGEHAAAWKKQAASVLLAAVQDYDQLAQFVAPKRLGRAVRVESWPAARVLATSLPALRFETDAAILYVRGGARLGSFVQAFLDAVCHALSVPPLKVAAAMTPVGADYSWVPLPRGSPPSGPESAARLSYRFGILLASLTVFGVRGLTRQHVVCVEDEPVLVLADTGLRNSARDVPGHCVAHERLRESALNVGILADSVCDGAPLATEPLGEEVLSERYPIAVSSDSDAAESAVSASTTAVFVAERVECGFVDAYRYLRLHGCSLVPRLRRLPGWEQVRCTQVMRHTATYLRHLAAAEHPDYLDSLHSRERLLATVAKAPTMAAITPEVLAEEISELVRGRIPRFRSAPDSRALEVPSGAVLDGYFPESALDRTERRVAALTDGDLSAQCQIVRYALASASPIRALGLGRIMRPAKPLTAAERDELLDGAVRVGRWLQRAAFLEDGLADWCGALINGRSQRRIRPVGADMYHGCAGIAVFLSYLARETGDASFRRLALEAAASSMVHLSGDTYTSGGGFAGRAGIASGVLHVASVLREGRLLEPVLSVCRAVPHLQDDARVPDLVQGTAGIAVVLLNVHRTTGADDLLPIALTLGRRLTARAAHGPQGCHWPNVAAPLDEISAGFAHGASGITWALAQLAANGDDEDIRQCVRRSLGGLLDRRHSWRGLLKPGPPAGLESRRDPGTPLSWCRGASGLAVCLATLPPEYFTSGAREALIVLVDVMCEGDETQTLCLCHGELGTADALMLAGVRLEDHILVAAAQRRALDVSRAAAADEHWGSTSDASEAVPGLLTGVAGVGYGLLRARDPITIPSVLAFAPPDPWVDGHGRQFS